MFDLLEFAASSPRRPTSALRWDQVDERQLQYAIDAGLGPLLFHASQETIGEAPAPWRDRLLGADLTARVRHGNQRDTMSELLDACEEGGVPVTLLKGISIADQHYPAPHHRPMGDIDILVREQDCAWVESMMLRRGFTPKDGYRADDGDAHRPPLLHRERDVWVEIHTALFPRDDRLRSNGLFSASQIASQEIDSEFDGRPVRRLSRELQLAYVASYWIRDLSRNPFHPSLVAPLMDAIYLIGDPGQPPDWDALFSWLDNELAAASLYITLACVAARGSDPSLLPILPRLASRQRIVGPAELRIILRMIDNGLHEGAPLMGRFGNRHPMIAHSVWNTLLSPGTHAGKVVSLPWNVVFPPWIADRYRLRYQIGRLKRFVRR